MIKELVVWHSRLNPHTMPEYLEYAFGVNDNKMYEKVTPFIFLAFIFYLEESNAGDFIYYKVKAYSLVKNESGQEQAIETYIDEAIDDSNTMYVSFEGNKVRCNEGQLGDLHDLLDSRNVADYITSIYDDYEPDVELFDQIWEIRKSLFAPVGTNFKYFLNTEKLIEYMEGDSY